MKLIIKQKILSWFDSYNVYDENDNVVFNIQGKMSWGHKLIIYDAAGTELGCIKEKIISMLPTFEIYKNNEKIGEIKKKFSFLKPQYALDVDNYEVEGNFLGMTYNVKKNNTIVATINKKIFAMSDTYTIDTQDEDALNVIMIATAIDIDLSNMSRNNRR